MEIDEMYNLQKALAEYFSKKRALNITREDIFNALFILYEEKENLEWLGDVWDLEIDFQTAASILSDFDFFALKNPIETEDIIPRHCLLIETKVQIKNAGRVWVIHKYDADPFPSNPHAHELTIASSLK